MGAARIPATTASELPIAKVRLLHFVEEYPRLSKTNESSRNARSEAPSDDFSTQRKVPKHVMSAKIKNHTR